jgi:hypothetical protein
MSSSGLLFQTGNGEQLPHGAGVELSIAWPAGGRSRLEVSGRIVRSQPGLAAMVLLRHGFLRANTAETSPE